MAITAAEVLEALHCEKPIGDFPSPSAATYDKIYRLPPLPYEDPQFATAILQEHLDEKTDQSSRSAPRQLYLFDRLNMILPHDSTERILHPMCGPGIEARFIRRLNPVGYLGIDLSEAAITHARTANDDLRFQFVVGDVRRIQRRYPTSFTCAMLTYEGINYFPPEQAVKVVQHTASRMQAGGILIIELHLPEYETPTPPKVSLQRSSLYCQGIPHIIAQRTVNANFASYAEIHILRDGILCDSFFSVRWHYSDRDIAFMAMQANMRLFHAETLHGLNPPTRLLLLERLA